MLTKTEYHELIRKEPEITFFYHDQPCIYTVNYKDKSFMVFLVDTDNTTDRFLLVEYTEPVSSLLNTGAITIREFVLHPENTTHSVTMEYPQNDEPHVLFSEQYEDSNTIPDEDLPTKDATWYIQPDDHSSLDL